MKKYYGFYRGKVVDTEDKDNMGRVQCRIMGIHSQLTTKGKTNGIPDDELPWCEQANSLFGGFGDSGAGISQVPENDSWVWIFFEQGDFMRPVYFAIITGKDDRDTDADKDDVTVIKTKSGHKITINDKDGEESITIYQVDDNTILMDKDGVKITDSKGDFIHFKANGGFEINASGGGAVQSMTLGDTLDTFLGTLGTWLGTHVHIDPISGTTGAPAQPVPTKPNIKSSKNKNN